MFISRRRHSRAIPQRGGSGVAGVALADEKTGQGEPTSEGCGLLGSLLRRRNRAQMGRRVGHGHVR